MPKDTVWLSREPSTGTPDKVAGEPSEPAAIARISQDGSTVPSCANWAWTLTLLPLAASPA